MMDEEDIDKWWDKNAIKVGDEKWILSNSFKSKMHASFLRLRYIIIKIFRRITDGY